MRWLGCENESLSGQCFCEQLLAAQLNERQTAGAQCLEHVAVEIVYVDAKSSLGERQNQWNANVTTPADHREVGILHTRRVPRGWADTGDIHARNPLCSVISMSLHCCAITG